MRETISFRLSSLLPSTLLSQRQSCVLAFWHQSHIDDALENTPGHLERYQEEKFETANHQYIFVVVVVLESELDLVLGSHPYLLFNYLAHPMLYSLGEIPFLFPT